MKYVVEFEETVKHRHQVTLECEDEDALEDALDLVYAPDFDSVLSELYSNGSVDIVDINRDYYVDCDGCEYYDDYECEDDNNDEEVDE